MGQTNVCSQCQAKEKQKLLRARKHVSYNRMKRQEYEQKKQQFKASRASRVGKAARDDNDNDDDDDIDNSDNGGGVFRRKVAGFA